jgi:hypothetical protein
VVFVKNLTRRPILSSFCQIPKFLADLPSNFNLDLLFTARIKQHISESLDESKKWNQRDCVLKSPLVVWYVLAMSIFRTQSMASILRQLLIVFRQKLPDFSWREVTPEAICHARDRLGPAPLKSFFQAVGRDIRAASPLGFKGFRVWAVDGVRFQVADTVKNEAAFGRPPASRGRTAFPQLLAVALVDVARRQVGDCDFQRSDGCERRGAAKVLESLGKEDLVLFDRGFPCSELFEQCTRRGVHFLARISSIWKPEILQVNGRGCCEVKVTSWIRYTPEEARMIAYSGSGRPRKGRNVEFRLRLISYQIGKEPPVRLLTSLTDTRLYPARELALLYHQRWEAELAYDELKTHLATVTHGTVATTFRSKTPERVYQEAYGLMIAYNLIRGLIVEAAEESGSDPLQISFVESLRLVQWALGQVCAWGTESSEARRRWLLQEIAKCCIRARRKRKYPRKVKIKMSNYGVKTPSDKGESRDFAAELKLQKIESRSGIAA